MSDVITLSLRAPLEHAIEVDRLTADRLALLDEGAIAALPVSQGRHPARLGDFFVVRGGRAPAVRIEGDLSRVHRLAAGNAGGEIVVDGDVGDEAGCGMSGGTLRITGNAGDRLGAAAAGAAKGMTGGEIIVLGSAGREAAARARRGLVVIAGDAGGEAARAIVAGTLVVLGRTGDAAGRGGKRGSIIACGPIAVPATYRYACTFEPPYVRLVMTYLRRRHGLAVADPIVEGRYRRYCGDAGEPGKGEILELIAE